MRRVLENIQAQFLFAYNGKTGGGRILLSALSLINDGYFECEFFCFPASLVSAFDLFSKA